MRLGVDFNILNQKGTPAFYSDIFANRPAFGFAGRVFISTDTGAIYEDTGSAWTLIADAGAGTTGTLQQVTTNGNTTSVGISVTAGGIGTNSLTVSGSRASFYNGTAAQLGMTLQNGSVPSTLTRGDLWLYSASSANNNLVLANDLYNSQFLLPLSNQVFTFPGASGTIGLSSSALTAGSVVFAGAGGVLSESNATLFWDNTNKRLGIGNAAPGAPLDVHGTGTAAQFNGTGTNNAYLQLQSAGVNKWRIGNTYAAGANNYDIYNNATTTTAISIDGTTSKATFNAGINTTGTADQMLQVYGSSPSLRLYNTITSPTITGFVGMATATNNFILGSASGDMCIGTSTAGKIYIGSGTTTVSPAMTILSSGNVGIGINTPTSKLHIYNASGDVFNTLEGLPAAASAYNRNKNGSRSWVTGVDGTSSNWVIIDETVGVVKIQVNTGGNLVHTAYNVGEGIQWKYNGGSNYGFYNNNSALILTNVGVANVGSFNMTTGIYTPTSDINKKKDFEDSKIGLNAILALKPTLYRMKTENDTAEKHLGFIAQEVKDVIKEAYVENADFIGLDFNPIVAALVKAIQELNDKLVKNNIN